MFGLLRKKRTALVEPAVIPTELQMVPVRRTAYETASDDGAALVREVVSFVDQMREEIALSAGEIPPLALQSYRVHSYVAQVNTGGHRQFIENSGVSFAENFIDVQVGLKAMGAMEHLEILEDMLAIVNLDPSVPALSDIAEELSVLDDELAALETSKSLASKHALWIQSWLILQVLDDAEYEARRTTGFCVNPLHDALAQYPVESISSELTEAQREFAMMRNSELEQDLSGASERQLS